MTFLKDLQNWAQQIKRDGISLWFASKHPLTPWYAKAIGIFVVAYALSPIDLIPDFIPILGYLDDVLLLPVLIWLVLKLLPPEVLAECRAKAEEWTKDNQPKPISLMGALLVVFFWFGGCFAIWHWYLQPN